MQEMGELLGVSKEEDKEVVILEDDEEEEEEEEEERESGSEVVKWERMLPRMVLRVLLVEADDSTRQIIAALLRKCNYKVAAVSDGLKAWEILKRRHSNIDLILTELDLPSISGYALLTLIMEHDGCKHIPVIIMSSQDSMNMVLKCMLKGAADFLIKPVRKNELKNLWRHVWRKLADMNVHNPQIQNLNSGQCKVEATFENHPATNHSSDNNSSSRKKSKGSEKVAEAQSSCTTPYLEAESACLDNMQDLSQIKRREGAGLSDKELRHHAKKIKLEKDLAFDSSDTRQTATRKALGGGQLDDDSGVRVVEDESFTGIATEDGIAGLDIQRHKTAFNVDARELPESSGNVVDLIGNINWQKSTMHQSSTNPTLNSVNSTPELELSLRGFHDPEAKGLDDRHILNHSTASAFSWYSGNKKPHVMVSVDDMMGLKGPADSPAWPNAFNSNGEIKPNILINHSAHSEYSPALARLPGITVDGGVWTGYSPMLQPTFGPVAPQTGRSTNSGSKREDSQFLASPSLHSDQGTHSSSQRGDPLGDTTNLSSGHDAHEVKHTESVEQHGYISSVVNPGSSTTPCNEFDDQPKSSTYGSVSEVTDANATTPGMMCTTSAVDESMRDDGGNTLDHDKFKPRMGPHSAEREAALAKFRLKRKGRCFEKKVRYQSRKRLAEQRPRVKGQFVRQALSEQVVTDVVDKP